LFATFTQIIVKCKDISDPLKAFERYIQKYKNDLSDVPAKESMRVNYGDASIEYFNKNKRKSFFLKIAQLCMAIGLLLIIPFVLCVICIIFKKI